MKRHAFAPLILENLRDGDMSLFSPQAGGIGKATCELDTELCHNGNRTLIWWELSRKEGTLADELIRFFWVVGCAPLSVKVSLVHWDWDMATFPRDASCEGLKLHENRGTTMHGLCQFRCHQLLALPGSCTSFPGNSPVIFLATNR